jgi:very-short-patch-repair endonuclease
MTNENPITKRARELRHNPTPAEALLWKELQYERLGVAFRRQYPLRFYLNNKKRYFIADFCCKSKKLVLELDGKIHDFQKDYDEVRDYIISQMGYTILRIKNEVVVHNLAAALQEIKKNII